MDPLDPPSSGSTRSRINSSARSTRNTPFPSGFDAEPRLPEADDGQARLERRQGLRREAGTRPRLTPPATVSEDLGGRGAAREP